MHSELAIALAENTKILMMRDGLSQRELAKKAGLSQTGVGFVLRYGDAQDRHAGLDTVEALAKAFGVSAASLLTRGFAAATAQNVHVLPLRSATVDGGRRAEPQSQGINVEYLQFILEQAAELKGWSIARRAAAVAHVYDEITKDEKTPTKAAVLKLLRSA